MKIRNAFPYGHYKGLDNPKRFKCKGIIDKALTDKEVTFKPIQEIDIIEIRNILITEIKKQIEEENNDKI